MDRVIIIVALLFAGLALWPLILLVAAKLLSRRQSAQSDPAAAQLTLKQSLFCGLIVLCAYFAMGELVVFLNGGCNTAIMAPCNVGDFIPEPLWIMTFFLGALLDPHILPIYLLIPLVFYLFMRSYIHGKSQYPIWQLAILAIIFCAAYAANVYSYSPQKLNTYSPHLKRSGGQ